MIEVEAKEAANAFKLTGQAILCWVRAVFKRKRRFFFFNDRTFVFFTLHAWLPFINVPFTRGQNKYLLALSQKMELRYIRHTVSILSWR